MSNCSDGRRGTPRGIVWYEVDPDETGQTLPLKKRYITGGICGSDRRPWRIKNRLGRRGQNHGLRKNQLVNFSSRSALSKGKSDP